MSLPLLFINLASDTDRRVRMEAEFARQSVPGERFEATRWATLPEAEQAALYSPTLNARQFHKPLVNGEKGCYASHLRCWQWLLDSSHAAVVVLEDDVTLGPGFAAVIAAIAALPTGWDMVKLIGRLDGKEGEKLCRSRPLLKGFALVDFLRVPSLTAGYVISRSGAQKLISSRIPFGRPVDVDLRHWWENALKIHGLVPAAITLDETSFQSSIGAKVTETSLAGKWRKFRHKARYSALNRWHLKA